MYLLFSSDMRVQRRECFIRINFKINTYRSYKYTARVKKMHPHDASQIILFNTARSPIII